MASSPSRSRNHILALSDDNAWDWLSSRLEPMTLPANTLLEARGQPVEWVYFPESGIASVITESGAGHRVESGIIGRDGMTGTGLSQGDDRCSQMIVVQIAATALRLSASDYRTVLEENPDMRTRALLFSRAFAIQAAHTALANGAGVLEQRLARWLLMLHDRVDDDVLAITHDYIATMLSVRRPGVSVALKELEEKGLVRVRRGLIEVMDRAGLLQHAGGLYGRTEEEYRRLLGWTSARAAN